MDWTPIIVASVAAVPGTLALIAQSKAQKASSKKTDAEAADVQVGTSLDLMREMRTDIADMKKRIRRLEVENVWLRNGVGVLIRQLREHDIPPEFTLDSMPVVEEE